MDRIMKKLFRFDQWFIAFRARQPLSIPLHMNGFQIIKPPAGHFYADPFIVEHNGKDYVFFEDYSIAGHKGVISFVAIEKDGSYGDCQVAIEKDYHLSYPFIFKEDGKIFMIPETSKNNTIELYEAVNFPCEWKLAHVLLEGFDASDTTLFSANKKWLFTLITAPGEREGNLFLFFADSIYGTWHPHPLNPVNSDPANSRPGGNLFYYGSRLIRPAQNGAVKYGRSLVFNEIFCMTEDTFSEIKLAEMGPSWLEYNKCFHTYNFNENFEVVDGLFSTTDYFKVFRHLQSVKQLSDKSSQRGSQHGRHGDYSQILGEEKRRRKDSSAPGGLNDDQTDDQL